MDPAMLLARLTALSQLSPAIRDPALGLKLRIRTIQESFFPIGEMLIRLLLEVSENPFL